jgi:hypothetical protein
MQADTRNEDPVELYILPQDPGSTPDPVKVKVRGPLLQGPIGDRIAVFDYNRDRDVVFRAARPRNGGFPRYDVDDFRFHQLNGYAIAARAVELVELELGRPLRWGFDGSRLTIVPHAGLLANAYYSAESHSLQFFSFLRGRNAYHTVLAHDIVAHETGHAILDAVRPRYYEPWHPETTALHEAFGDLAALFAALSHDIVRRRVAGRLERANLLSEVAEGFEESGEGGWTSLRSLVDAKPSAWQDTLEPHDLSLRLTSAVYRALVKLNALIARRGKSRLDALKLARTVIQRMAVRALDYLPPADATLDEFATAMLVADHVAEPKDEQGYRELVRGVLVGRGLVPDDLSMEADPAKWQCYPPSWPRLSHRDAYLFLDANREKLALAPHADLRDFVVRDVQVKRPPDGPGEIDQLVILYEYPVDVELRGAEAEAAGEPWITLRGGGTLVFHPSGRLIHHAEKPVTRERVRQTLRFLKDGDGSLFVAMDGTLDDQLRRAAALRPWVVERASGRATLRANLAATCGRGAVQKARARARRRR